MGHPRLCPRRSADRWERGRASRPPRTRTLCAAAAGGEGRTVVKADLWTLSAHLGVVEGLAVVSTTRFARSEGALPRRRPGETR